MECSNLISLDQCYIGKIEDALTKFNLAFQQQGLDGEQRDYYQTVQPAYDELIKIIDEVVEKRDQITPNLVNEDKSIQEIKKKYDNLLLLREKIDSKMKNLTDKNSIPNLYKENLDISVYTNTLWIILATSLLYFTFLQIRD
jgi:hypothetical protein